MTSLVASSKISTGDRVPVSDARSMAAFALRATALSGPVPMQRLPSKAVQHVSEEIIKYPDEING